MTSWLFDQNEEKVTFCSVNDLPSVLKLANNNPVWPSASWKRTWPAASPSLLHHKHGAWNKPETKSRREVWPGPWAGYTFHHSVCACGAHGPAAEEELHVASVIIYYEDSRSPKSPVAIGPARLQVCCVSNGTTQPPSPTSASAGSSSPLAPHCNSDPPWPFSSALALSPAFGFGLTACPRLQLGPWSFRIHQAPSSLQLRLVGHRSACATDIRVFGCAFLLLRRAPPILVLCFTSALFPLLVSLMFVNWDTNVPCSVNTLYFSASAQLLYLSPEFVLW